MTLSIKIFTLNDPTVLLLKGTLHPKTIKMQKLCSFNPTTSKPSCYRCHHFLISGVNCSVNVSKSLVTHSVVVACLYSIIQFIALSQLQHLHLPEVSGTLHLHFQLPVFLLFSSSIFSGVSGSDEKQNAFSKEHHCYCHTASKNKMKSR